MLTRVHKILIGLLAVQLVLAVITLTRGNDAAPSKPQPLLAGFDAAGVTRVQVFGKTDKPLDLVKKDGTWVLASSYGYPVEASKLTDLLTPIAKLAAAGPMATQKSRHKQLRVDDAEFERKLVITAGGKDTTLFVGGSAGARRIAVRLGGDDNVYAVSGLSPYAIGEQPQQWVDPSYVKIPRDEIARISVQRDTGALELAHADSGWTVTLGGAPLALAAGEVLNTAEIERLVDLATTLELTAPADPARDASKPTATITIERKAKGTATPAPVIIDVVRDGASSWVRERGNPRAALVDTSRLEGLLGATRDTLVTKPAPPAPDANAKHDTPAPGAPTASPPG